MKSMRAPRLVIMMVIAVAAGGCATSAKRTSSSPAAIYVEGELVRQTGSRISHIVPKGGAAGIVADRPGMIVGARMIEQTQNDFLSQYGGK